MKDIFKSTIFSIIILSALYYCMAYPADVGESISISIQRCTDVIIPSMFLFMYLTSVAVNAGIHNNAGKIFNPVSLRIFRMKGSHFGIFLLSLFSGYPAGIKLLSDLYRQDKLTKQEFERLSCFCFAGGPAFISGTVSGILFPETSAGTLCFISVTTGNIITAIAGRFSVPKITEEKKHVKINISAETITLPAISTAKAIFQMCVMITAFGGLYKIAELSGITQIITDITSYLCFTDTDTAKAIVSSFFEISNIITLPAETPSLLPVISALLSFGGICVFAQVLVLSGGLINIRRFLCARLFSAIISAVTCRLISRYFYLGASDAFAEIKLHSDEKILPTAFLIIMTLMLLSLSKSYRQSD